jgi:hypothetical protein
VPDGDLEPLAPEPVTTFDEVPGEVVGGRSTSRRTVAIATVAALVLAAAVTGVVLHAGGHTHHPAPGPVQLTDVEAGAVAAALVEDVRRGHDAAVVARFDPRLQPLEDALSLHAMWSRVVMAYGHVTSQGTPSVNDVGAKQVSIPLAMSRGHVAAMVVLLSSGAVAELAFLPALAPDTVLLASEDDRAAQYVDDLARGDAVSVVAALDPLGRVTLAPSALQQLWGTFERAYGNFVDAGTPADEGTPGIVDVPVRWATARSTVLVYFDWNGRLAGLVPLRPDAPAGAGAGADVQRSPAAAAVATAAVNELASGQFAAVAARLDRLGAATTNAGALATAWAAAAGRAGPLREIGAPAVVSTGPNAVTYELALSFRHGTGHVQLAVDDTLRIMWLFVGKGPPTRTAGT